MRFGLAALIAHAAGASRPHLLFGPTANQPKSIASETVAAVATDVAGWDGVRGEVVDQRRAPHS
jgi:hypothetical protein